MDIDINLAAQEDAKNRKLFLVLGLGGIAAWAGLIVFADFKSTFWMWLPLLPSVVHALLYAFGRNRSFANRMPYLRITEEKIETSSGGVFPKQTTEYWKDVKEIEVKLFEIRLRRHDNQETRVNLEG